MTASWDPNLNTLVYGEDDAGNKITDPSELLGEVPVMPPEREEGESGFEYRTRLKRDAERAAFEQSAAEAVTAADDKPFISDKTFTDVGKAALNVVPAFATDVVDLALTGADLVAETARSTFDPNYDFSWRNIGDDSDNPLTVWRRNTFVPGGFDTKAGEMTNLVLRLGGDAIGFKWLFKAPVIANRFKKLAQLTGLAQDLTKTRRIASVARVAKGAQKRSAFANAARRASKYDYLDDTFAAISKMDNAKDLTAWWKNAVNGARVYTKNKYLNPKTMAETIAWDMFAAFNVMGEGDDFMDETIFDFAAEIGINNPAKSDPLDSALWRKAKGMLDASLVGLAGGGIVDLIRIKRFQGAIKKAKPAQRKELVKALEANAEEIGRGIAGLLPPAGMTGGARREVATQFLDQLDNNRQQIDEFGRIQADAVANTQRALDAKAAAADAEYLDGLRTKQPIAGALPPGVRGGDLATTPKGPAGLLPSSSQIPEGMPNPFADGEGFIAQGVRVRAAEPTISAIGIRRFSREMIAAGYTPQQVQKAIVSSLPRKRVDLLEYMDQGLAITDEGVINAADSVWANYITELGIDEGWARIDRLTGEVRFIRSAAAAADQSALITKQAQALDELQALAYQKQQDEAMQAARLDRDQIAPQETAVDSQQAGQLAEDEFARNRGIEVDQALANSGLDPAVRDAEINVVDAKLNADALSQEELARAVTEVTSPNPDEQVRELLGVNPDEVDVIIEKAPDGRGWVVTGPSGEQLGERFATKRAAQRKAKAEASRLKSDLQKRAQQIAEDRAGAVADFNKFDAARDPSLTGSVKLTQPQLNELIANHPLFKDVLDLAGSKKTYELSQEMMDAFVNDARSLLAYGVDGRRARLLKTLMDKFDTAVKLLEPEARVRREVDSIIDQNNSYLDHGDYCK